VRYSVDVEGNATGVVASHAVLRYLTEDQAESEAFDWFRTPSFQFSMGLESDTASNLVPAGIQGLVTAGVFKPADFQRYFTTGAAIPILAALRQRPKFQIKGLRAESGHTETKVTPNSVTQIIKELTSLALLHPKMRPQIADAKAFASSLFARIRLPSVWTDGEVEVVFEWIEGEKHAVVSFEGGGTFGYTLREGDRFNPGRYPGHLGLPAPLDLIQYVGTA
jgi:hypothetical protein